MLNKKIFSTIITVFILSSCVDYNTAPAQTIENKPNTIVDTDNPMNVVIAQLSSKSGDWDQTAYSSYKMYLKSNDKDFLRTSLVFAMASGNFELANKVKTKIKSPSVDVSYFLLFLDIYNKISNDISIQNVNVPKQSDTIYDMISLMKMLEISFDSSDSITIEDIEKIKLNTKESLMKSLELYFKSLALININKPNEAVVLLKESIRLNPKNYNAYIALRDLGADESAFYYKNGGSREILESDIKTPKTLKSQMAEIFYVLGNNMSDTLEVESQAVLSVAQKLDPNHPFVAFYIAKNFSDLGNGKTSQKYYNLVPKFSPVYKISQINMWTYYYDNVDKNYAIKGLKSLLKEHPNSENIMLNLSSKLNDLNRFDESLDLLNSFVKNNPQLDVSNDFLLNVNYAIIYDNLLNTNKTIEHLEIANKLNPLNPDVQNYLGYVLIDKELDIKRGMSLIRKAISEQPYNSSYLDSLGYGYYKAGDFINAKKWLQMALDNSTDSIITYHMGLVYESLNDILGACNYFNKAKTLKEDLSIKDELDKKLKMCK